MITMSLISENGADFILNLSLISYRNEHRSKKEAEMYKSPLLSLSACTISLNLPFLVSQSQTLSLYKRNLPSLFAVSANSDNISGENDGGMSEANKGSGTTARGRRLLKVREEKRKRDYDRLHDYPSWAKYLFLPPSLQSVCLFAFVARKSEPLGEFCMETGYWRVLVKMTKSFELFLVIA